MIADLEPQRIGVSYGRAPSHWWPGWLQARLQTGGAPVGPVRTPWLVLGSATLILTVLLSCSISSTLYHQAGATSGFLLLVTQRNFKGPVGLGLVEDPVGIVVLAVCALTPIFCARQVDAISNFVKANRDNVPTGANMAPAVDEAALNMFGDRANRAFDRIGATVSSALYLLVACALTALLYYLLLAHGLFASWHDAGPSDFPKAVVNGWWANWSVNKLQAALLLVASVWMFYTVLKQIAMGAVFAAYAYRALRAGFCVVPNVEANVDGHWGLLTLRTFMQWTYFSTLSHFVMALGVLAVWLPFGPWTAPVLALIVVNNCLTVLFPSWVAHRSVLMHRLAYVRRMGLKAPVSEEQVKILDTLWGLPNLPFKLRSAASAVTGYLLIPVLLAVISGILKAK